MSRIAIIAAMERELAPLVQGWKKETISHRSQAFTFFEKANIVAIVSGIGRRHAEQAARAAVETFQPSLLVSGGVAGALIRSLKVGSIFVPNVVVDAGDGAEYRCRADSSHMSGGVLVTADEIAGSQAKQALVEQFHGLVVDMEAAGVAKVAQENHIDFRCVKAISDEAGFVMPPLAKFIDLDGNFQSGRFAAWAALRPWQWANVIALGRNSSRASKALCDWLANYLARSLPTQEVVTLNRTEFSEAKR